MCKRGGYFCTSMTHACTLTHFVLFWPVPSEGRKSGTCDLLQKQLTLSEVLGRDDFNDVVAG